MSCGRRVSLTTTKDAVVASPQTVTALAPPQSVKASPQPLVTKEKPAGSKLERYMEIVNRILKDYRALPTEWREMVRKGL